MSDIVAPRTALSKGLLITKFTRLRSSRVMSVWMVDGSAPASFSGNVPTASLATLYVLMKCEGATTSGITGAEFRIETPAGGAFLFTGEQPAAGAIPQLGSAFGAGTNIAFPDCRSSSVVPILSFQVYSSGAPATDVVLRVRAKSPPTNPAFSCPLATLSGAGADPS